MVILIVVHGNSVSYGAFRGNQRPFYITTSGPGLKMISKGTKPFLFAFPGPCDFFFSLLVFYPSVLLWRLHDDVKYHKTYHSDTRGICWGLSVWRINDHFTDLRACTP